MKEVYQTLRYRNNNEFVLTNGPFKCEKDNAWLGHGYYFWEDSLRPAKYWGKKFHDDNYIICRGFCDINEDNCFYLVGCVKHNEFLEEALRQIQDMGELTSGITIPHVIDFLVKNGQFPFYASRAQTDKSFSRDQYLTEDDFNEDLMFNDEAIPFNKKLTAPKVNLHIVIQLCVYDLEKVGFTGFELVHENRK